MPASITDILTTQQDGHTVDWLCRLRGHTAPTMSGQTAQSPSWLPDRVAWRLRILRETLGLQKAEMADSIGLDRSAYIKVEAGERGLKPEFAYRICERYGVSMDYLYRGRVHDLPDSLRKPVMTALTAPQA